MCLGIPAKVIKVWKEKEMRYATVEMGGVQKNILLVMSDPVDSGDYIIVHAGMGISKISEEEVERTLKIWEEYLKELEAT